MEKTPDGLRPGPTDDSRIASLNKRVIREPLASAQETFWSSPFIHREGGELALLLQFPTNGLLGNSLTSVRIGIQYRGV